MKRLFAFILSLLFFATVSFAVIGCKKAEEQKPEGEAVTGTTAPAPAPEPAPAPAPEPAPVPAPGTTVPAAK